jgi:hypothetical protein
MRLQGLSLVALLAGCASIGSQAGQPAGDPGPTAQELHGLMTMSAVAIQAEAEGTVTVEAPRVAWHRCAPTGIRNRFRCCYADERGRRATAVVQRLPEEAWEYRGKWRWITGAPRCGMRY